MKKVQVLVFLAFLFPLVLAGDPEFPAALQTSVLTETASITGTESEALSAIPFSDENAPELNIEGLLRRLIAETAQLYLGVPYKAAGVTPEGFDCSGLIYFVYREVTGMELSRSTTGLWTSGKAVALKDVKPGDVLIFTTVRPGASHAGIVLENTAQGITFTHAASQGSKIGVIISGLNEAYYKSRIMGARTYF
jgi:hypothetical protein